jgi:hypothetical protein
VASLKCPLIEELDTAWRLRNAWMALDSIVYATPILRDTPLSGFLSAKLDGTLIG